MLGYLLKKKSNKYIQAACICMYLHMYLSMSIPLMYGKRVTRQREMYMFINV